MSFISDVVDFIRSVRNAVFSSQGNDESEALSLWNSLMKGTAYPFPFTDDQKLVIRENADAVSVKEVDDFEEFDPTTPYDSGDIMRHKGKLYKANQEHLGAWDSSHFTQTNVISILSSRIAALEERVAALEE